LFCQQTQNNALKYHLVIAEPPFTVKTINCVHQTGSTASWSMLTSHSMIIDVYGYQICHGVSHCVKNRSCSYQAWSESQWTVL